MESGASTGNAVSSPANEGGGLQIALHVQHIDLELALVLKSKEK
jgi:hypothetical protein